MGPGDRRENYSFPPDWYVGGNLKVLNLFCYHKVERKRGRESTGRGVVISQRCQKSPVLGAEISAIY